MCLNLSCPYYFIKYLTYIAVVEIKLYSHRKCLINAAKFTIQLSDDKKLVNMLTDVTLGFKVVTLQQKKYYIKNQWNKFRRVIILLSISMQKKKIAFGN